MADKGGGGAGGGGGGGSAGSGSTGVSTRLGLIPDFSNPRILSPSSYTSLGDILAGVGVTQGSATWPTANLALFIPFWLTKTEVVRKLYLFNGAAVSGNVDMGIYHDDGGGVIDRIVSNGGSAQSGTSALQELSVQQLDLTAGTYYLAIVADNVTAATTRWQLGTMQWKAAGLAQMASAYPLPKIATLAAMGQDYLPFGGVAFRTLVA